MSMGRKSATNVGPPSDNDSFGGMRRHRRVAPSRPLNDPRVATAGLNDTAARSIGEPTQPLPTSVGSHSGLQTPVVHKARSILS